MPDNPTGPGSAPAGAGQPTTGQASPAGGAAGSGAAPAKDQLTARLESLAATVEKIAKDRDELRSLHDRQMNELRSTLAATAATRRAPARTATDADEDGGAAGNGHGTVRDPEFEQDVALIKFRQLNPDWADYWPDMEPILLDRTRAAPFAVYREDGRGVDFYRSIQAVRDHLELLKLRKAKTEFDASRRTADTTRDSLRRDAAISGSGAASIEDIPDWSKLSPREKMRKAYELGFITDAEIDMENPPEALRDLVPKR